MYNLNCFNISIFMTLLYQNKKSVIQPLCSAKVLRSLPLSASNVLTMPSRKIYKYEVFQ